MNSREDTLPPDEAPFQGLVGKTFRESKPHGPSEIDRIVITVPETVAR